VHDGSIFFLSANIEYGQADAVVRYDPESGSSRRVALPVARPDAHATVRGDVVYVLAATGALDAVDTRAGKRIWHLETSVNRGSELVADDGHVYFTAADGRLLAVDAGRGRLVGQTRARPGSNSDTVAGSLPEPVLAHHRIYATAPDGTVFAMDAREPSAW
jgi:outer membrane protein assembly factor BamB